MSLAVFFAESVTAEERNAIRDAFAGIEPRGYDCWHVIVSVDETGNWSMTVYGPDHHRRVYRVPEGDSAPDLPRYLAALIEAETLTFPSCPTYNFAFSLAELARLGVPYDARTAFQGRITVDGEMIAIANLEDLYRRGMLPLVFMGLTVAEAGASQVTHGDPR